MKVPPCTFSQPLENKSASSIWRDCLLFIRDNIGEHKFKTWFSPIKPISYSHPTIVIEVPSQFWYEWLEEYHFHLLRSAIRHSIGEEGLLEYRIVVNREKEEKEEDNFSIKLSQRGEEDFQLPLAYIAENHFNGTSSYLKTGTSFPCLLNRSYTLDSFIEGNCNRIARTAAEAIARSPNNNAFSPLYIYGITGVGKTHLIQGISHAVKKYHKNNFEVLYLTTERFISNYIQAIRLKKSVDYIASYYRYGVLVIDDIQFLQGKKHTQQIFFHLFNYFHQNHKQIIISSDCMPHHIPDLNERLISRFNWGLSTQLLPPDIETRRRILHVKSKNNGIKLNDDVVEYIASTFKSNVRSLEGAVIRLLAVSTFDQDNDLPLERVQLILRDMVKEENPPCITIDQIQSIVSDYTGISIDLLKSKTRKKEIVKARKVAMYLAKKWTDYSFKAIGIHFGGRDHSTVIYSISMADKLIESDSNYGQMIRYIEQKIKNDKI